MKKFLSQMTSEQGPVQTAVPCSVGARAYFSSNSQASADFARFGRAAFLSAPIPLLGAVGVAHWHILCEGMKYERQT